MIQNFRVKFDAMVATAMQKYSGRLPFAGKYLGLAQKLVDDNADALANWLSDPANYGGDYNLAVDKLMKFIQDNVSLPIYLIWLRPFEGMILAEVATYIKASLPSIVSVLITSGDQPHQ